MENNDNSSPAENQPTPSADIPTELGRKYFANTLNENDPFAEISAKTAPFIQTSPFQSLLITPVQNHPLDDSYHLAPTPPKLPPRTSPFSPAQTSADPLATHLSSHLWNPPPPSCTCSENHDIHFSNQYLGLIPAEAYTDSMAAISQLYLSEQAQNGRTHRMKTLVSETVANLSVASLDLDAIKPLVDQSNWRAVLLWSERNLQVLKTASHHQLLMIFPQLMHLWLYRITALLKIKMAKVACAQLESFPSLDCPLFYYETYPESFPSMYGSIIPFQFRLVVAQAYFLDGNHEKSFFLLFQLKISCRKIISWIENSTPDQTPQFKNDLYSSPNYIVRFFPNPNDISTGLKLWKSRYQAVSSLIASQFLDCKDYSSAFSMYQDLSLFFSH
eukprot:Sdes_comp19388_c0_seq1m10688